MMLSLAACGNYDSSSSVNETAGTAVSEQTILGQKSEKGSKYTLYLGLNDKDTFEQKISTEDAIEKANKIYAPLIRAATPSSPQRAAGQMTTEH